MSQYWIKASIQYVIYSQMSLIICNHNRKLFLQTNQNWIRFNYLTNNVPFCDYGVQIWFVTCSLTIFSFFTYFDTYRVSVTCSIFKSWQSLHYSWTPLLWPSDPVYQYSLFAQSCFNKNVIFKDVHIRTCLISTVKYFVFYLILFVCVSVWVCDFFVLN